MAYVDELNIVIDQSGEVVYYSVVYAKPLKASTQYQAVLYPRFNLESKLNSFIEEIIAKQPKWKPAMMDGKPVASFVSLYMGGC